MRRFPLHLVLFVATFATSLSAVAPATAPAADNPSMDQAIFADGFRSGWIDYGWAKNNAANASPVHGGKTSLKIACNPFDALHIHHSTLDTRLYESLKFWIHGGDTGGQLLKLTAYMSGALQKRSVLLPALTKEWKQVTIPLADLGVAGAADLDGFLIGNIDGIQRTPYFLDDVHLVAAPVPAKLTISIDAGTALQTIDDRLFALNNGAYESLEAFNSHLPLVGDADIRALRFPGGSVADTYHWKTGQCASDQGVTPMDLKFDTFAAGARRLRAQMCITVNYGSGTPAEAAEWVKYANVTQHADVRYWELGNECNLGAEYDKNDRPHDPFTYATRASQYITQMKAADPTIKIGVVTGGDEDGQDNGYADHPAANPRTGEQHNGWDPIVLSNLKRLGTIPDFVIHHRYVYLGGQEHDTSLLLSSRAWKPDIEHIRQMLKDYLGDDASKVEIQVTEHNSTASAPAKQTTSLVNGLFLADSIASASETELRSLYFWQASDDAQNPGNNPTLYGWRAYGGYGIMERGPASGPKFELYPTYYAYKLMKHYARGGDAAVSAESNYALLAVHAAKRNDGSLSLLIINKHPTAVYNASITIKGFTPSKVATVYSYGISQDEAARTKSGSPDVAAGQFDNARAAFSYTFPPYSATILSLSPGK